MKEIEEKDKTIENIIDAGDLADGGASPVPVDDTPDMSSDVPVEAPEDDEFDPAEAAIVAKIIARMAVEAEARQAGQDAESESAGDAAQDAENADAGDAAQKTDHAEETGAAGSSDQIPADPAAPRRPTEEELLAAEAAEKAAKKTFKGKAKAARRRLFSVAAPDNRKFAWPVLIAEVLALAALLFVLGKYAHVAPETPVQYSNPDKADVVSCSDGLLMVNGVTVKVPDEGNVKYSVSYVWAEEDTDYPSVPHTIVASYYGDPVDEDKDQEEKDKEQEKDKGKDAKGKDTDEGGDKVIESDSSPLDAPAEEEASPSEEKGPVLYEVSLYKDSFTAKKDLPEGKDHKNWFADWKREKTDGIYKYPHKVGNIRGFCISTMDSEKAKADYRSFTYYFAVPENQGVAIYVLEGLCYDPDSRGEFRTIVKNALNSITVNQEEA